MTRSELIIRLANRIGTGDAYYKAYAKTCVELLLGAMATALSAGHRIEIRGFGSFATGVIPSRTARNPKTGATFTTAAKRRVKFKMGQELKERANRRL